VRANADRSGRDFHRLSLGYRTGKSGEPVTDKVIPLNITYPLLSSCAKSCRCNGENDATTSEKFTTRSLPTRRWPVPQERTVPPFLLYLFQRSASWVSLSVFVSLFLCLLLLFSICLPPLSLFLSRLLTLFCLSLSINYTNKYARLYTSITKTVPNVASSPGEISPYRLLRPFYERAIAHACERVYLAWLIMHTFKLHYFSLFPLFFPLSLGSDAWQ